MARPKLSDSAATFRFQFWKALAFGVVTATFFCVLTAALIKAVWLGDIAGVGFIVLVVLMASFGTAAIEYLGIAARGPIAVEMDEHGVTFYRMPKVAWQEVAAVTALKGRKRHRYVGITLHDPRKFQDRLPWPAQLKSKIWQWRYGQDLVVEGFLLRFGETEEIAQAAQKIASKKT